MMATKHQLVWVSGWPGCGKTTVGDYLKAECGYTHVDVDDEFQLPEVVANERGSVLSSSVKGWFESWGQFFRGKVPDAPLYEPYLLRVCQRVRQAQAFGEPIVITQGLHRWGRDFVRQQLEGIVFIGLTAPPEKVALRNLIKETRYWEIKGIDFGKSFSDRSEEPLSEAAYMKWFVSQDTMTKTLADTGRLIRDGMGMDEGEPESFNIDISNDATVLAKVREAFGLPEAEGPVDARPFSEVNWTKLAAHERRGKEDSAKNGEKFVG